MKKIIGIIICLLILSAFIGWIFWEKKNATRADNPAVLHPEVAGKRIVDRIELLEPKKAYNFHLINQKGEKNSLEDFKGKLVLIGFIYTNCPDVCGLLTASFKRIQREFEEIIDKDLSLILITTDPARDNIERVKFYTESYGGKWYFLTGKEEDLKAVWENYHVYVQPKKSAGIVYHTYMVVLIDRKGFIRYRYIGLVDPKEVISKDIKNLLKEGKNT